MHVYVAISFLNLHVQVQQVRYIRERKEQLSIVQACHGDQTSGHLGYRKTLARITERFMWITQARIDIGVTLLSYSGTIVHNDL